LVHISGSIFTTVAVALERFTATYRPHYYNQVIKNVNGHSRRLFKYTLTISALAIIFNIPKFFETEIISEAGETFVDLTSLRKNSLYITFYHCWARLLVLGLVPFSVISFLNIKIYQAIKNLQKTNEKKEACLCIILVTIVLTFFVCHLPRLILNIHETFNLDQITLCSWTPLGGFPIWSIILGRISQVLLVVNSSANFYIYCIIGANHRKYFNIKLCC